MPGIATDYNRRYKRKMMETLYALDLSHNSEYKRPPYHYGMLGSQPIFLNTEPDWTADFWGVMQVKSQSQNKPNWFRRLMLRWLLGIKIE